MRRQGPQGTDRPDRRAGGRVDAALSPVVTPRAAAGSKIAAALPERARRAADARRVLEDPQAARTRGESSSRPQPARRAPLVCDASARTRRGPAVDSNDAGPRRSLDDTDLHTRARS